MKRIILFLITLLTLAFATTGFAHTMPESELFLRGVGPGKTLEQAKIAFGEPADRQIFKGDGIRAVTYVYSPLFEIIARTGADDATPEEKLKIVGYSIKDKNITTPSGFCVGAPYQNVQNKFGAGEKFTEYDGRIGYIYSFNNGLTTLTFYVDGNNAITEIYLGTEF